MQLDGQASALESATALKKIEDQDDHSEHEEDVDPRPECRTADQTYDPEKEKNDSDRPKHFE